MSATSAKPFAIACTVLAAVWLYELFAPPAAYSVPAVRVPAVAPLVSAPPPAAIAGAESFAAIIDRPLFDPGRKKYIAPKANDGNAAPPPPPTLFLVGVIIDSEKRIAMVKSSDAMLAASMRVGDKTAGWQLSAIEPDKIVLSAGTAQHEIKLESNKAPTETPSRPGTSVAAPSGTPRDAGQPQSTQ